MLHSLVLSGLTAVGGNILVPLGYALSQLALEIVTFVRQSDDLIRVNWELTSWLCMLALLLGTKRTADNGPIVVDEATRQLASALFDAHTTNRLEVDELMGILALVDDLLVKASFPLEQGAFGGFLEQLKGFFINPKSSPEQQAMSLLEVMTLWKGHLKAVFFTKHLDGMTKEEFAQLLMKYITANGPGALDAVLQGNHPMAVMQRWKDASEEDMLNLVQTVHDAKLAADECYLHAYDTGVYRPFQILQAGRIHTTEEEFGPQMKRIIFSREQATNWVLRQLLADRGLSPESYERLVRECKFPAVHALQKEWVDFYHSHQYAVRSFVQTVDKGNGRPFMMKAANEARMRAMVTEIERKE